jgi:hypothetical protein
MIATLPARTSVVKKDEQLPGDQASVDPSPPVEPAGLASAEAEFRGSLLRPVKTDMTYRRVIATAADAIAFEQSYRSDKYPRSHGTQAAFPAEVQLRYGKLDVVARSAAFYKMHAWVEERSKGFSLEVQGRFLAKRRREFLLIDEFIPLPSFCQSLAYETHGAEDRIERFGNARMRTISVDDWKPHRTQIYHDLGVFAGVDQLPIDPFKVAIPFHSHYLKSAYQDGPSPGDIDALFHLKLLFAPRSGKNILYSGVTNAVVELPLRFAPIPWSAGDEPTPTNPEDCRILVENGMLAGCEFPLEAGAELILGRSGDCDISFDDPNISRRHARLFWDADGRLVLEDLDSTYGVMVEDKHIKGDRWVLDHPCRLRLSPNTHCSVTF